MKKVYVEITNNCNLDCSFCIKNTRKSMFMSEDNFEVILNKLKNTTSYLYFHVMGEPLLHPLINEFIDIA
ncbi:MAG TPA: radical SAM protein, partial [Candidatus Onthocola stercoravium]|nr:radical SAM protein [Candidatus Onthocola stercoravium]